jgi:GNAT superfamily N-acetyltransferase
MTPAMTIRVYRDSDREPVVSLNAYGLAAAGVPTDVDVYAGDLDDIMNTYLTDRSTLLVGELDGRIVAMGALRGIDAYTCEITRMRVDPAFQGHGYGKQMLTALEDEARGFGYCEAVLLTGPHQHPAIDIYQAAGYAIASSENYVGIPGVRLKKFLTVKG